MRWMARMMLMLMRLHDKVISDVISRPGCCTSHVEMACPWCMVTLWRVADAFNKRCLCKSKGTVHQLTAHGADSCERPTACPF